MLDNGKQERKHLQCFKDVMFVSVESAAPAKKYVVVANDNVLTTKLVVADPIIWKGKRL